MNNLLIRKSIAVLILSGAVALTYNLLLPVSGLEDQSSQSKSAKQSDQQNDLPQAVSDVVRTENFSSAVLTATEDLPDSSISTLSELETNDPEDQDVNSGRGPSDARREAWEALEEEGPPPWAAARDKVKEGWFDNDDREGPPPWAGPNAGRGPSVEDREDWEALEEEGPPPWAAARDKDKEGWLNDEDRTGPPPWAAARGKDKTIDSQLDS